MIRLVVCDMDGTMIGHDEVIPTDAPAWIAALEKRGILFTVATGRSEGYMRSKAMEMGLLHPYIATNGATIMDGPSAVVRKQFPILPIRPLIELCYQEGLSVLFTIEGESRTERITPWIMKEGAKRSRPYQAEPFRPEEWETLSVDKVLIMDSVREGKILEIEQKLRAISGGFSYVRYQLKALELNAQNVNKATGLQTLSTILDIPLQEILVIGDDDNDIEMFQAAGHSAAVANASEKARIHAEYVCQNREFAGVKEAVSKFCGGN